MRLNVCFNEMALFGLFAALIKGRSSYGRNGGQSTRGDGTLKFNFTLLEDHIYHCSPEFLVQIYCIPRLTVFLDCVVLVSLHGD